MDNSKIMIEEETMEELKKIAEQNGEALEDLTIRFENIMKDLLAQVPQEILEMQRVNSSFVNNIEYKAAI